MKRFLLILLIATSCAPVYVPNARNAPMFKEAGEVQINAQLSGTRGYEAQMGAAVSNHIGIISNIAYAKSSSTTEDGDYFRHAFFEGGIGYFDNSDKFAFEVYAGYGKGRGTVDGDFDIFDESDEVRVRSRYQRFFIQPAIGSNHRRIFNWTGVLRFSVVDFTSFTSNGVEAQLSTDPVLFIEPAFIGKFNFGESGIYANFQGGLSFPRQEIDFDYEPVFVSIGLGVRFSLIGKPKTQE